MSNESNVRPIRLGARVRDLDGREGVVLSSKLGNELPFWGFATRCLTLVRYDDGEEVGVPEFSDDAGPILTVLGDTP